MTRIGRYDELPFGFSWVMDEAMARTSHAIADDGRVWLIDPVDAGDAIERAQGLGEPVAVLQLLDRHNRDCEPVARRLGVPHVAIPGALPDTPFEVVPVLDHRFWRERALWWPARRALIVAEALGTSPMFTGGGPAVGVHMMLRLTPPRGLRACDAQHLLVGHGAGVHGPSTAAAIDEALGRSYRDLPKVLVKLPFALRGR
ncbi:hypothetical protein [Capillimicrobium parvum]|uniref:Uncharacterized protein n=1 Tax=Capillimicrobium parvum TaxID=2884022 RepID=A0A9E6XZG2_9ACTN|nr:hypothetical protein [Capillimicrobium parvum]UGS36606.1 hypothetical protein DSM104329_03014 [Capillimicrobium parvum]